MKLLVLILFVSPFFLLVSKAQNLIPNPDFENGPDSSAYGWENRLQGCVVQGSMNGPDDWYKVSQSPDRLINGDIACDFSEVDAQHGKAYVDFVYNESGKCRLLAPLEVGEKYTLTFWVRWQTFQGAAEQPSGIKFIFSKGGNVLTPALVDNAEEWKLIEIEFEAKVASKEIEIMGTIDVFGGVCLDNLTLMKTSETDSLSASGVAPIPRAELKRYLNK